MENKTEFTLRSDGKWVQWELMNSFVPKEKGGIGHTATWDKWKWVVTGVYTRLGLAEDED
ncbi:MAG: hypothetical protein CMN56_13975 [Sneathiella sp.]|jgi:hypothetical protein|uniref:hypothetical protein n=1 Tax=Sneathiella sp. TaxID=1964365 RepID=UPI000C469807|nr:hypothetical protein [Sneathiella sp.]MAZ04236.1 hypothetical protein [Sneathiella sp.]|tara:strand:+ start:101 stop:280 length:180 start_codon:yes stop_codon:yes gene_type:complete